MKISKNRELLWCSKHDEPVIKYDDDSWSCRWQLVVETGDESQCVIGELPKENK